MQKINMEEINENKEEIKEEKKQEEPRAENKKSSKEEKIKIWLRNKNNLWFLALIIFAVGIRLYYFFMTYQQPLWWDESEYLSISKNLSFGVPYDISPQRLILFPFLASIIFMIGFGETSVRFLLVLLPSILVVLVTYLFVKEMYNEKIALIASFITSVCWIHLFYSMRVQNDEIGFLFGLLALFLFWKGYIFGKNNKLVYLSAFFIALSFMIRPTGIYYAAVLFIFLFITENFKIFKKKELWIMPLIFILTLSPHMIWSYYYHGDALAFTSAYGGPDVTYESGWHLINFIFDYPEKVFFWFFIIGLVTLIPLILSFDRILKGEKKYQADLLMVICILFVEIFSIFVLRDAENRWMVLMSLGIFVISAKGILLVTNYTGKYAGKYAAIALMILILSAGAYVQVKHADDIIQYKIGSYAPVRDAGYWIKDNSEKGVVVFSRSWPQNTYYSERETFTFDAYGTDEKNVTDLLKVIKEKKPSFFVFSIFEPYGEWMHQIPINNSDYFNPVYACATKDNLATYTCTDNLTSLGGNAVLVVYQIDSDFYKNV